MFVNSLQTISYVVWSESVFLSDKMFYQLVFFFIAKKLGIWTKKSVYKPATPPKDGCFFFDFGADAASSSSSSNIKEISAGPFSRVNVQKKKIEFVYGNVCFYPIKWWMKNCMKTMCVYAKKIVWRKVTPNSAATPPKDGCFVLPDIYEGEWDANWM